MGHNKHDTSRLLNNTWTLGLSYSLQGILSQWEWAGASLLEDESHMAITADDIKVTTKHVNEFPPLKIQPAC